MSNPICNVCGRTTEPGEEFTHLKLYIRGSEGTNACEDCRMDITNFTRNLASSMQRATLRLRKEKKPKTFFGFPLQRLRDTGGIPEGSIFTTIMSGSGVGMTSLNADSVSPNAFRDQIIETGLIKTGKGDEFTWDEENKLWRETDPNPDQPGVMRALEAGPTGFPETDLDWSWTPKGFMLGEVKHRDDRLLFKGKLEHGDTIEDEGV